MLWLVILVKGSPGTGPQDVSYPVPGSVQHILKFKHLTQEASTVPAPPQGFDSTQ